MARRPPVRSNRPPVKAPSRARAPKPRPQGPGLAAALARPKPAAVPPVGTIANPHTDSIAAPAPRLNPYTNQQLGANEYVGVAGSEAEHPGMTRIPENGWWDPSNANYERRNYYIAPDGKMIAREAGFDESSEDPWDTGRTSEINAEYESRPGGTSIHMSEPGIQRWGQGKPRPALPSYGQAAGGAAQSGGIPTALASLLGGGPTEQQLTPQRQLMGKNDPNELLQALIAQLRGRLGQTSPI